MRISRDDKKAPQHKLPGCRPDERGHEQGSSTEPQAIHPTYAIRRELDRAGEVVVGLRAGTKSRAGLR